MEMQKYLRSEQYYSDLYDRLTIEECRRIEKFHREYKPSEQVGKRIAELESEVVRQTGLHWELFLITGERYFNKAKTIWEWITRDTAKDELYASAQAPEGIACLTCGSSMRPASKDLHDWDSDGKKRVLFMYDCPKGCQPRRAFFHDGEEWKPKPHPCPKCGQTLKTTDRRQADTIITAESCSQCGYTHKDELDLSPKQEQPDPDFAQDRFRFCLTEEQGQNYLYAKLQLDQMKKMVDKWKEREKHKDVYDKVAKLQKLTISQMQKQLSSALEKHGYANLSLGSPVLGRDVCVSFTVLDRKDSRQPYDSRIALKKAIVQTLAKTNWRLMSEGVDFRLGVLSGRLRGYEREAELSKVVSKEYE